MEQKKVNKILPRVLTAVGLGSMITAVFACGKATPKAIMLLDKAERDKGAPLEPVEKLKTAAPQYIPTMIFAAAGAGCIIASDVIEYKEIGSLLALGTTAEHAYEECKHLLNKRDDEMDSYKEKVVEKLGEETEKIIQKEVDNNYIEKKYDMPLLTTNMRPTDPNDCLCIDTFTGHVFYSSKEKIREAVIDLNEQKQSGMDITLDDWCDAVGENKLSIGRDLIWDSTDTRQIEVSVDKDPYDVYYKIRFVRGHGPRGVIKV